MRLMEVDRGCRGQQVQMLQHLLNTTGRARPTLELDGVFGARTDRAVRQYQAGRSLPVDGVVGARTWSSLGVGPASLPPSDALAGRTVEATMPTRNVAIPGIRHLPPPVDAAPRSAALVAKVISAVPAGRARAIAGSPGTGIGAPWMQVAKAEMFVAEVAGRGDNPRIMEYHATTTLGSQPDSVPWCSSFVNWCLRQVGIRGTNSAAAASWGNWGRALDTSRYGCIVQLRTARRGHDGATGSSSGNHVGFFVSGTTTHLTLLGGNQSNQVKESRFRLSSYDIRAMRWPTGG